MQPTFSATLRRRIGRFLGGCLGVGSALSVSCGRQDGVVGTMFPADAASSASVFETEFVGNSGEWGVDTMLPRASVSFGQADRAARDGKVAELRFPGDASRAAGDGVGPDYVTQMATLAEFSFGTLRTRVSFGSCAADEEVIQSVLGYFSDGSDLNHNGITDDVEIDLQIACSSPNTVYLTVYTDYQSTSNSTQFRKLAHIVDFSRGAEYASVADDSDEFVAAGTSAVLLRPNLVAPDTYYELGFEWHSDSVRFFLFDGADELTLWKLQDPAHIPAHSVSLMYNLWHPASHWFPASGTANFPANDLVMRVDWLRYESLSR
jgi:hypothetical protein